MASARVWVGVLLLELETPGCESLKAKRALIKPVVERLRARFPVSVARLDGLDAFDWERIGATAISHDPAWLEGMLHKALAFVESHGLRVRAVSVEVDAWS